MTEITLDEIYSKVQKFTEEPLNSKLRTDKQASLRYMYYSLATEFTRCSQSEISTKVNRNRSLVVYGLKELPFILKSNKKYNTIYRRLYNYFNQKTLNDFGSDISSSGVNDLRYCETVLLSTLKDVSSSDMFDLIGTRIKPYLNMLKSRKLHKKEEYVKPAVRNHLQDTI